MIKLAIRDPSDCIEFPVHPIKPEKTQEIRGHIAFPPKGRHLAHDLSYVMDKIYLLSDLGIKEITIHTMGLNLTALGHISSVTSALDVKLNIENRKAGRTSRIEDLKKILWSTGAGLTFDIGHTEANGNTDRYIKEFGDLIKNVHLYKIEGDKGHEPFDNFYDFNQVFEKVYKLPNLEWIVIETNQVPEILYWYKIFISCQEE